MSVHDPQLDHLDLSAPKDRATWVQAQCKELGFDDVGIVAADAPLRHLDKLSSYIAEERHGPLAYMEQTAEIRADIQKRLPGAKSVVVVVANYFHGHHHELAPAYDPDHEPTDDPKKTAHSQARVSRYAWGADYHQVLRRKLRKLRKRMLASVDPNAQISLFSDAQPVYERAWAEAAGLGFIGKSTMFIHRDMGTWTFLAGLITDLDLGQAARPPMTDFCGTCTRCVDACPTNAFVEPWRLDANRCLSTWTVEKPTDERADAPQFSGHGWAVGCDVCQEVCPWNRFEKISSEHRFAPRDGHVFLNAEQLPEDVAGTPLARPGAEGLLASIRRALNDDSP